MNAIMNGTPMPLREGRRRTAANFHRGSIFDHANAAACREDEETTSPRSEHHPFDSPSPVTRKYARREGRVDEQADDDSF